MKERPILFSAPMVRAILAGKKTQTRRICKPQPVSVGSLGKRRVYRDEDFKSAWETIKGTGQCDQDRDCPYGEPRDRLWVKESIRRVAEPVGEERWCESEYIADGEPTEADVWPWKNRALPSIHMPRGLSRLTLEITDVRVERLQSISEADALAEGIPQDAIEPFRRVEQVTRPAAQAYAELWESINGAGSWNDNPWVWVVTFARADA